MDRPELLEPMEGADVPWLKDITQCERELKRRGYREDFRIDEQGLSTYQGEKRYQPNEISIDNFYRFEGVSDPGDMMVLYAITTNDGVMGTLSDGYGTYSTQPISEFIVKVTDIQKKNPGEHA